MIGHRQNKEITDSGEDGDGARHSFGERRRCMMRSCFRKGMWLPFSRLYRPSCGRFSIKDRLATLVF